MYYKHTLQSTVLELYIRLASAVSSCGPWPQPNVLAMYPVDWLGVSRLEHSTLEKTIYPILGLSL